MIFSKHPLQQLHNEESRVIARVDLANNKSVIIAAIHLVSTEGKSLKR